MNQSIDNLFYTDTSWFNFELLYFISSQTIASGEKNVNTYNLC